MSDSLLVATSKAIRDAIEAERIREGGGFAVNSFLLDFDFDGREKDLAPKENQVHVRVIVPRRWDTIDRFDRSSLHYVGAFDIDVRKKLGPASQEPKTCLAEQGELSTLTRLVEQIHGMFWDQTICVYPAGYEYVAEWIPSRSGVPKSSEILVAYSTKLLREQRLFYGCCREIFELTKGRS